MAKTNNDLARVTLSFSPYRRTPTGACMLLVSIRRRSVAVRSLGRGRIWWLGASNWPAGGHTGGEKRSPRARGAGRRWCAASRALASSPISFALSMTRSVNSWIRSPMDSESSFACGAWSWCRPSQASRQARAELQSERSVANPSKPTLQRTQAALRAIIGRGREHGPRRWPCRRWSGPCPSCPCSAETHAAVRSMKRWWRGRGKDARPHCRLQDAASAVAVAGLAAAASGSGGEGTTGVSGHQAETRALPFTLSWTSSACRASSSGVRTASHAE